MKWGSQLFGPWLVLPALAAGLLASVAAAAPRRDTQLEAQMMAHITVLASDEFQGREPGTDGEAKTLAYLGKKWFEIGLSSGTNDPGNEWFAPVSLIERRPALSSARFFRRGIPQAIDPDAVQVLTSGQRSLVKNAPLMFVGKLSGMMPPIRCCAIRAQHGVALYFRFQSAEHKLPIYSALRPIVLATCHTGQPVLIGWRGRKDQVLHFRLPLNRSISPNGQQMILAPSTSP
jgi:hypothetical protein